MTNTPPKPHSQTRLPAGGLSPEGQAAYWARNIRILLSLLLIWFSVSFGAGILMVDWLDQFRLPGTGFPLGFWFAQQGSIYVFVALIFFYVFRMNRLDREFGVDEVSE